MFTAKKKLQRIFFLESALHALLNISARAMAMEREKKN
jgi:hypothetical protein